MTTTILTIGLILVGAVILALAIIRTREIFKSLTLKDFKRNWKRLYILMGFFLIGYLGVIYIVISGNEQLLLVSTGVIFFFGAVFVFFVVLAGSGTFKRLQELNSGLENKVDQLKIQNEEMRQFNYATSHDLKEPLNTIITSVSLIKETNEEKIDDSAKRMINYAVKAADRMRDLIDSLSLYLKVGRERQFKETDLNQLVKEVKEELQGIIQETKTEVEVGKMPTIEVLDMDVKRIFQNLIGNAIKYRNQERTPLIRIKAEEDKPQGLWIFSVSDNGLGIAKEQYQTVFQIFKQLHGRDAYEGMGIGLSICKKVVELHGGEIWLNSSVNEGTTFYFTLRA